jgi:hypothetical protein
MQQNTNHLIKCFLPSFKHVFTAPIKRKIQLAQENISVIKNKGSFTRIILYENVSINFAIERQIAKNMNHK